MQVTAGNGMLRCHGCSAEETGWCGALMPSQGPGQLFIQCVVTGIVRQRLTYVQRGTIPGTGRGAVTVCAVAAGAVERMLSGCCSVCVPTRHVVVLVGPVDAIWLDKHGNAWQGIQISRCCLYPESGVLSL